MVSIKEFGDTAKGLSRNPLGIIALFIVLVYGFASLVVGFSDELTAGERGPMIWFMISFPVLVLGVFSWLVASHHTKLYAPSDYKNDEAFIEATKMMQAVAELIPEQVDKAGEQMGVEITGVVGERDDALEKIDELQEYIRKLVKSNKELEDLLGKVAKE